MSQTQHFSVSQQNTIRRYTELNKYAQKEQIVLAGSSLMEQFPIYELMISAGLHKTLYNRGISGMTISDYCNVLDICVLCLRPQKLFINIGSNDLNLPGDTIGNLLSAYDLLLQNIQRALPSCKISLLAYYPCTQGCASAPVPEGKIARTMESIHAANRGLAQLAKKLNLDFLNLNAGITDAFGYLREDIAADPIHLHPNGYAIIFDALKPHL